MANWMRQLFGTTPATAPYTAASDPVPPEKDHATWVDPSANLNQDWARKLSNYARRCRDELVRAEVPTWNDTRPGNGTTYSGDFWVVSLDVSEARSKVLARRQVANGRLQPMEQHIDSECTALLLSTNGALATSGGVLRYWSAVLYNGDHASFGPISGLGDGWADLQWAWGNLGRWRDHRPYNANRNGVVEHNGETISMAHQEFTGIWPRRGDRKPPGLWTSLALKKFVESGGKIQEPPHF